MKNIFLLMSLVIGLSVTITTTAAPPPFVGSVDITPDNPTTNVGAPGVDLTAVWTASTDVTRWEWIIDGFSQGINNIPDEQKLSGDRTDNFQFAAPGVYEVCFHVYHHVQDRTAEDCVIVTVDNQVCTWYGESAWSDGDRYVDPGNWATYTAYYGVADSIVLYAGQTLDAGTVDFSTPNAGLVTITITLADGWRFKDVDENVKIQDYDATPPAENPAPGLFEHKGHATGTSFSIDVPENHFYGVHVDVEQCVIEE